MYGQCMMRGLDVLKSARDRDPGMAYHPVRLKSGNVWFSFGLLRHRLTATLVRIRCNSAVMKRTRTNLPGRSNTTVGHRNSKFSPCSGICCVPHLEFRSAGNKHPNVPMRFFVACHDILGCFTRCTIVFIFVCNHPIPHQPSHHFTASSIARQLLRLNNLPISLVAPSSSHCISQPCCALAQSPSQQSLGARLSMPPLQPLQSHQCASILCGLQLHGRHAIHCDTFQLLHRSQPLSLQSPPL